MNMQNQIKRKYHLKIVIIVIIVMMLFLQLQEGLSVQGAFNDVSQITQEDVVIEEPSNLYAMAASLIDGNSGRVLFEKEGTTPMPMASTTKIMTCILALELGELDDVVEVSSYAASMPEVNMNMRAGETYRLEDLLYSLMLESHNDTAVAIAEHLGGSVEGFAELMNQKARELGCMDTYYITPNGLDDQVEYVNEMGEVIIQAHETTAIDLATIMMYCAKQSPQREKFLEITRMPTYAFTSGGRSFSCTNHNSYLTMEETALSGKTGFTNAAGYCYVGIVEEGEECYVVALLACGWPNHKTYKWSDMDTLVEYGYKMYEVGTLEEVKVNEEDLDFVLIENAQSDSLGSEVRISVKIVEHMEQEAYVKRVDENFSVNIQQEKVLVAPVEEHLVVGTILYYLEEECIGKAEILLANTNTIETIDFWWCFCEIFKRLLV